MGAGTDRLPPLRVPAPDWKRATSQLLKNAGLAAAGALILNIVLEVLLLVSINPTNLGYSATVVGQNGALVTAMGLALVLPAVTLVGARRVLGLAGSGEWTAARRWLPPLVVIGFISWIVPGYLLLETWNLFNARMGDRENPPVARTIP